MKLRKIKRIKMQQSLYRMRNFEPVYDLDVIVKEMDLSLRKYQDNLRLGYLLFSHKGPIHGSIVGVTGYTIGA